MLKKRLIPVLFLRNGFLVRSENFSIHQNLGNPVSQVERYNSWDVDELIYIDISETKNYDSNRTDLGTMGGAIAHTIEDIIPIVSKECFMPLTCGGGIKNLEDMRRRFELGADKITINSEALRRPDFINEAAKEFGSQAIVVSMDAKRMNGNEHQVFTEFGKKTTGIKVEDWALQAQEQGAGEIFLNSIDNDGQAQGYDLELIRKVVKATKIPVIACGGAGAYKDFSSAIEDSNASAAAAGNIFHFKELAYPMAKRQLKKAGLNVR